VEQVAVRVWVVVVVREVVFEAVVKDELAVPMVNEEVVEEGVNEDVETSVLVGPVAEALVDLEDVEGGV